MKPACGQQTGPKTQGWNRVHDKITNDATYAWQATWHLPVVEGATTGWWIQHKFLLDN